MLPALLRGTLVVSEWVPLRSVIPYEGAIVWAAYDELVATATAVLRDYAGQYRRVHGGEGLEPTLARMRQLSRVALGAVLERRFSGCAEHGKRKGSGVIF